MKYEELRVTVVLKEPISFRNIGESIGSLLHFTMLKDEKLKAEHKDTNIKHYVYSHLYPTEQDGFYKPGMGYMFRLRSADDTFLDKMEDLLKGINFKEFIVLNIERRFVPKGKQNGIKTLTPFVITLKDSETKYWKVNESGEDIKTLLEKNISNKYRQWSGEDRVEFSFIKDVKMLNQKPTYYVYKNIKMLANKAMIIFNDDEASKRIRDFVVCTGIGEKSSVVGSGFAETF